MLVQVLPKRTSNSLRLDQKAWDAQPRAQFCSKANSLRPELSLQSPVDKYQRLMTPTGLMAVQNHKIMASGRPYSKRQSQRSLLAVYPADHATVRSSLDPT